MTIMDMAAQKDRPAYVTFHIVTEEDRQQSRVLGYCKMRDVEMVHITPAYTKDVMKFVVTDWWKNLENDAAGGRIPMEWVQRYKAQYEAWKKGQTLPIDGIPIKGWGVITPAEQETLIRMNILTVEDLARVNEDGLRRIGMGAVNLKNKASAWLQQLQDKGPLTQEMAALKAENSVLKGSLSALENQVALLSARLGAGAAPLQAVVQPVQHEIAASDILDTHESLVAAYTAKHGKAPHHRMKDESIAKALE